ncbi:MAG: hypothetical protein JXR91_06735 [Deltaproteobacteria bacterium]|nr:hypothetical protein [Deltaproteobacteria bacterium]
MPKCKICSESFDKDELSSMSIKGKKVQLCEECFEIAQEEENILEESEAVVQNMMGFKGRR